MTKYKGCLVVPHDEQWRSLQQPLREDCESLPGSARELGRGERLASTRVRRDNLMHEMEAIVLKEAELNSSLELLDDTRQRCAQQHGEIVQRLEQYERVLHNLETRRSTDTELPHPVDNLLNEEECVRWEKTKEMVTLVLPEVLSRLEDHIELNNAKMRDVRERVEEVRAKRLALREEIALKEEDIALMLKDRSFYSETK